MGGRSWHYKELDTLERMWPLRSLRDIYEALPNRSRHAINNMACYRKIRRLPEARRANGASVPDLPLVIVALRRAREAQGLTLAQAAKRIGIARVTLQKYESLWNRPRFLMLLDWAQALGYEVNLRQIKFR